VNDKPKFVERFERTPSSEAKKLLEELLGFINMEPPEDEEIDEETRRLDREQNRIALFENHLGGYLSDPNFVPDNLYANIKQEQVAKGTVWEQFDLTVVFCAGAIRAEGEGREREAWTLYADACIYYMATRWNWSQSMGQEMYPKDFARRGAKAVHKKHAALKQHAIERFRTETFPSKDRAAEIIAPEIHMAVRTVRDWLKGV